MIRRLKADVLSQLPPKVRQRIPFDLPKEAAKVQRCPSHTHTGFMFLHFLGMPLTIDSSFVDEEKQERANPDALMIKISPH